MMRTFGLILLAGFCMLTGQARAADAGFSFNDKAGEYLDVLMDGRIVARYMYACDKSTPQRLHETYKPYLHVFDAEGAAPITKGAGGGFTHHRGIFIGWNKLGYNGKTYDRWHMKGGEIIHQKFTEQKADATTATFTSLTHWNDESGKPMVEEQRTTTIRRAPAGGRAIIDFISTLKACGGEVALDGDPEHAGVHYRPANEVTTAETVYAYPVENPNAHKDLDYPWVGETYSLKGKQHSVVHFNHPQNPKKTLYSAYRDYGRFGAFFKATIPADKTLTVRYRFLIVDGPMPSAELIQKTMDDFTGTSSTAAPKITVKPAAKK